MKAPDPTKVFKRAARALSKGRSSSTPPTRAAEHDPDSRIRTTAYPIDRVPFVSEGSLRNHAITYSYYCVGERIANQIGTEHVNWCSFAAWASRTVGHVLNEDELPGRLAAAMQRAPRFTRRALLKCVSIVRLALFRRHRAALIEGNTAVFTDIAQRFVELIPFLGPTLDDARFEAWLAGFSAPASRPDLTDQLDHLRDGFRLYRRAASITGTDPDDRRRRHEMLFVAAAHVGAYEQLLLQPSIEHALLLRAGTGAEPRGLRGVAARGITKLMVVNTPVGAVRIATPIPDSPWSGQASPLVTRTKPATLHAEALYERFPLPPDGRVTNWADYQQRMGWIVEFFRWFSADPAFVGNPFDRADLKTKSTMDRIIAEAVDRFGAPRDVATMNDIDLAHAQLIAEYVNELSLGLIPAPIIAEGDLLDARSKTDPAVDELVGAISRQTGAVKPDELTREVMRLVHSPPQSASAIHLQVHRFLTAGAMPPSWADDAKIRTARQFFADHALDITSVLFYCALPTCYACGDGAAIVRLTEELVSHTHRRTSETAQFIFDVMDFGSDTKSGLESFSPGTSVHHAIMGVRLLHGTVRFYARHQRVGSPEPINHEEMLGTILAFSTVTLRGLRRIGIQPTPAEAEAYWHIWAVVGSMLGIDESLVNVQLEEALRLTDRLANRLVRPSTAGAELADALLADMHRSSVAIMGWPGRFVRGVHPALIAHMSQADVALALHLRPSLLARSVVSCTPVFIAAGHRMRRSWSPLRRSANWWARGILREYMTIDRGPNRAKFDFGLVTTSPPPRSR